MACCALVDVLLTGLQAGALLGLGQLLLALKPSRAPALLHISSVHLPTACWQGMQLGLLDSVAHLEVTKTSGRLTSQSEKTSVSAAPMALSLPCCDMPSTSLQPPLVDSLQHGHDMPKSSNRGVWQDLQEETALLYKVCTSPDTNGV